MIHLRIPTDALTPLGEEYVWVSDLERGLYLQKHQSPEGVTYGITHHSGYAVSLYAYRYRDAKRLQHRLLALPVDWTQPVGMVRELHQPPDPQAFIIAAILREWEETHAVWLETEE